MKKVALAAVFAAAASTANAGNYEVTPIIEPPVIIEEATSSSGAGLVVPLMVAAVLFAVFS